jgi:hypothetical protein
MVEAFERFDVWRVYVDPQYIEHLAHRQRAPAEVNVYDDDRRQLHTISKDRPMSPNKIDAPRRRPVVGGARRRDRRRSSTPPRSSLRATRRAAASGWRR